MTRENDPPFDAAFLARQQDYYSARAPEYDEWWERRGRYDYGPAANAQWFREQQEVRAALETLSLTGHVLELACGTGNWTRLAARHATTVTAVDGSAEMLALNADRLRDSRIRYVQADLFSWEPEQTYDAVLFGFWLSHVPPERLLRFLDNVRRALSPSGKLFFVDSRRDPLTTSPDQPLPEPDRSWLVRKLKDGQEFPIVKVFYEPEALSQTFARCGLRVQVRETERFFLYGAGHRDDTLASDTIPTDADSTAE